MTVYVYIEIYIYMYIYNTIFCLLIVCGNIGSRMCLNMITNLHVAVDYSSTNLLSMVYEPTVNLA